MKITIEDDDGHALIVLMPLGEDDAGDDLRRPIVSDQEIADMCKRISPLALGKMITTEHVADEVNRAVELIKARRRFL